MPTRNLSKFADHIKLTYVPYYVRFVFSNDLLVEVKCSDRTNGYKEYKKQSEEYMYRVHRNFKKLFMTFRSIFRIVLF